MTESQGAVALTKNPPAFGNIRVRPATRPLPPALFTIALYLVVFKDALRVLEFMVSFPIPFSAISAAATLLLIVKNILHIIARKCQNNLAVGWTALTLFIFLTVIAHLLPSGLITARDYFGITLVQLLFPVAAATSAMAYDLNTYFCRNKNIYIIIFSILGIAICQILYISFDKLAAAKLLMQLYKEGLIVFPLQTARGGYSVRAPGVFYSAFTLAMFCNWVVATALFRPRRSYLWAMFALAAIIILMFTFNRNGIVMCAVVIGMRVLFGSDVRGAYWKIGLVTLAAVAFAVAVPMVSIFSKISTNDETAYGKTSTLATRANTWTDLLSNRWDELVLGSGRVQGVEIIGEEPVLVDNFLLNTAFQAGLPALSVAVILLFVTFVGLMNARRYTPWSGQATALFVSAIFGFALNIVFFEPIYQFFYLASIISVIGTARMRAQQLGISKKRWRLTA